MASLAGYTREQLHECAQHYFKRGGVTEPEVALLEIGGERMILKDYARTPGWFGVLIAPILIAREATALAQLDDLDGIPKLLRRIDRRALLMECLPARPWAEVRPDDGSYARLAALIDAMHARGIAHCDLRAPSNILVSDGGQPCIVDFVARVRRGAQWNAPWNGLFARFCTADRSALVKLKQRYAGHLVTDAEQAAMAHEGLLERTARRLGADIRRLTRFLVRS